MSVAKFGHPHHHPEIISATWIMIVILLGVAAFAILSLMGRVAG